MLRELVIGAAFIGLLTLGAGEAMAQIIPYGFFFDLDGGACYWLGAC